MPECLAALAPLLIEAEDTSLKLGWIDAFFIIFFGYGFISAHRLGFFGELPRAAAWIASLGLGVRWYPYVASQIEQSGKVGPEAAALYGFLLIGIFFLSVGYVIGMTITRIRKKAVEGGVDLWGGFLLGPIKMIAAYFWVVIALLLLPSIWTRNHIGLGTFSGGLVLRYCSDVRERVEGSKGKKDSMDEFIERKRKKSQDAIEPSEEEEIPPSDNPTGGS